jgi:undecaprenyl-diphosphatase
VDASQITLLALIQGLTEFLPISSSGHLILSPYLFGYTDQGLAFDVAVHFGTLFAVVTYFRRDIVSIALAWLGSLGRRQQVTHEALLGWGIIIGTLPVVLAGLLLKGFVESELRAPWVIAASTIAFGLLLGWVDLRARRERPLARLTLKDALLIGCCQAIALIPGTSRSGITMTAGLMLGLTREAASRFSFLLAIPAVLASTLLVSRDLVVAQAAVDWGALLMGVVLSALAAFAAIHYFLRFIERIGMWPFVVYRLFLGLVILVLII